ncbi:Pyoverdine/dityrosine biosynthesis protein-domain-containing protein [Ampelomyces quisqualis]|uniref:Pyoverdine/dityrosine biosynthesis protein-domain-containing protein n=1 Tax=Ampelomyces quisqualis TaxID=50730 RepID=A0A6A5QX33_AMPQU|nr:Pyoverdine/dityrosine biosynthesis protein-domain-containing protein [Ampelomyces quisqualis]
MANDNSHTGVAEKVLEVLGTILLTKLPGAHQKWDQGAPTFIAVIQKFVEKGEPIKMALPAFPWKSANKVEKVLGTLPDKAEEVSLARLNGICESIRKFYRPGAEILIISDGLVYNDLLTVSDRDTWAYGETLRDMAVKKNFKNLRFSRLKDLVDMPGLPDELDEVTYVANATNFRRALINQFGDPNFDATREIAEKEDTRLTYQGYSRNLGHDLRFIFNRSESRSGKQYKRDVKYLSKQMIIRGDAFARATKKYAPDHLRLSIHQSTGEHKVSISLLPTTGMYTTPWHCCVAFKNDGTIVSRPKIEFEFDPTFDLVYENGQPSYYQERSTTEMTELDLQEEEDDD